MRHIRNLIPPPLFVAVAALALFVGNDLLKQDQPHLTESSASSTESNKLLSLQESVNPQGQDQSAERAYNARLAEIADRPLFSETRQRPEKAPAQPDPEPEEEVLVQDVMETPPPPAPALPTAPQLEYLGFVRSAESLRALIVERPSGVEAWLEEGSTVQDWTVTNVSEKEVQFERLGFVHVVAINH